MKCWKSTSNKWATTVSKHWSPLKNESHYLPPTGCRSRQCQKEQRHSNTACILYRSHYRQLPACNQFNFFVFWQIQRESILSERSCLKGSTISQEARRLEARTWKLNDGITYPMNNEIFENQIGTSRDVTSIQLLLVSPRNIKIVHKMC